MKTWVVIIAMLTGGMVSHSQLPGYLGVGNIYTYSENDGIDENNFFVCGVASDGRVFFHSHAGDLYVKGNNYVRRIKFSSSIIPLHITMVLEKGNEEYIAFGDRFFYSIKNDSVIKASAYPENAIGYFWLRDNILLVNVNNPRKIFQFDKDSFILKYSIPVEFKESKLYVDSLQDLWMVNWHDNQSDYFKIKDLNKHEFQFTIPSSNNNRYGKSLKQQYPVKFNFAPITDILFVHPGNLSFRNYSFKRFLIAEMGNQHYSVSDSTHKSTKLYILYSDKIMEQNIFHQFTTTFYFGTFNKPFRYFPYLKKYPKIYNDNSASGIHVIVQDSLERIWAGSYEGELSVIDKNKIRRFQNEKFYFLPGAIASKNYVYLNSEKNGFRLLQYDRNGHRKGMMSDVHFISSYFNKRKQLLYLGSTSNGLWITDFASLESGFPNWKIIDSTEGNWLQNSISSITEDTAGRIWMGGRLKGFAVYDPRKNHANTWLISRGESSFGFWSSLTDDRGTVWLGTDSKGLMYYDDYNIQSIIPEKIKRINHPLLPDQSQIMQLTQWGEWLLIGTSKNILLLNLDEWYKKKKILIRYLNPEETNFSAKLQQNAVLIDKRDSSAWFSTNDMLYQWDVKQWLSLPAYPVHPNITLHQDGQDVLVSNEEVFNIGASKNTIRLSIWFQSKDNMPRYMSVGLFRNDDSISLPAPNLETQFTFANLAPGSYKIFVQICQSDGSVSSHKFSLVINKFWWQHWWVWLITSVFLFGMIIQLILNRNKALLAKEIIKRKEAELEAMKAESQKKLAALQIASLSNQIRPHFILNALNTVGAELDNKPQAESILSRLGESVDLIFSHAKKQKIVHSLLDEWQLVKNVIDIHKIMYLKKMDTLLPTQETIDNESELQMPLGLIQIPVENALLHGLSNRQEGPWKLIIQIEECKDKVTISITDNGVGRAKAATLSNYPKHGTGIRNLNSILEIVNNGKETKISIQYLDDIFTNGTESFGTRVIISIPKNFQYEI